MTWKERDNYVKKEKEKGGITIMRDKFAFGSGVPDMHETLSNFPEQFGDGPRKPEIKAETAKESDKTTDNLKCGWFWFRPIYLQKFRTAKWALFWLCWAGAMQGTSALVF